MSGKAKMYIRGYNGEGAGSAFIDRFTFGTGVSHVSLEFVLPNQHEEVEAIQFKGVICHKPYTHEEKNFVRYYVPLTDEQVFEAHELAKSLVGSSYDWCGIWGFMVRRKRHSLYKWFCSELDAYVCYKVGYPLSRREPYRETPTSICETYRIEEVDDTQTGGA